MKTLKIFKKVKIGAKSVEIIEKVFIEKWAGGVSPQKLLIECFWGLESAVPAPSRAQRREAADRCSWNMVGDRPYLELVSSHEIIRIWTENRLAQRDGAVRRRPRSECMVHDRPLLSRPGG